MICCHRPDVLNNFQTRGLVFSYFQFAPQIIGPVLAVGISQGLPKVMSYENTEGLGEGSTHREDLVGRKAEQNQIHKPPTQPRHETRALGFHRRGIVANLALCLQEEKRRRLRNSEGVGHKGSQA